MTRTGPFYGEKYNQLVGIAPQVEAAGMATAPMAPVDQAMIDSELRANSMPLIEEANLGNGIDMARVRLSKDLIDYLVSEATRLSAVFGGGPVILRSSARGDSVGNGVYASQRFDPNAGSAADAFGVVVSSYFSDEGRIFRERAGIEPGFAAFIQPLVGNAVDGDYCDSSLRGPDGVRLFMTPYSGNARLATLLHPDGAFKIQKGIGSAVEIPGLPSIDFKIKGWNAYPPDEAMFFLAENKISPRNRDAFKTITQTGHYVLENGVWRRGFDEFHPAATRIRGEGELTLGGLKAALTQLNDSLGSKPTYYEFAVRREGDGEQLYIIQKGGIKDKFGSNKTETVDQKLVLVSSVTVEAGHGSSPVFDTIVCLTDRKNKADLYAFDQTEAAAGGYLLAFHAQSTTRGNEIDLTRLRNARALATFESSDWSHTGPPQEHIAGYSDQVGTPLLSIQTSGGGWASLTGLYHGSPNPPSPQGTLLVRKGSFQVVTEAAGYEGLILDLNRS